MPTNGQQVEKNKIIACVEQLLPKADEITKRQELHVVEAEIEKLSAKVERLRKLGDFSPRVKLENTLIDLSRARKQRQEILSLFENQCIRAPIPGIIKLTDIYPGQVLKAEELLAEIFTPGYFYIIIQSPNVLHASEIQQAYVCHPCNPDQMFPLFLKGETPQMGKDDSPILTFSPATPLTEFVIGTTVEVILYIQGTKMKHTN